MEWLCTPLAQLAPWAPNLPLAVMAAGPRTRPAHGGKMNSVVYYPFVEDPHVAPFVGSCSAAERAQAQAQGIPLQVRPDVARRMRTREGLTPTADLPRLADAESAP